MLELAPLSREALQSVLDWNRGTSPQFLRQWSGWSFCYPLTWEQLESRLEDADACGFQITLSGKIIGMAELMRIDRRERSATVGHFLLDPAYTGRGYGTCALENLKKLAMQLGVKRLYLHVFADNRPALRCYEKANFAVVGRQLLSDGQTGLRMLCDLPAVSADGSNPP